MTAAVSVSTPSDREIVLTRTFQASAGSVFAAFTQPSLLVRWLGARGWNLAQCDVDLREGGAWRYVHHGPDGQRMANGGTYLTVRPPELLVLTEHFDDQSYPGDTVITHEFTEHDGRTTVTSTIRYATPEGRDRVLRYPMARGVGESYERLDLLIVGQTDWRNAMNWTLEVVIVPVSDLDRSKAFYADQLGFNVDHDTAFGDDMRIIQLTPPGSGCSVVIGKGAVPQMPPGSIKGLQLVVNDIHKAHEFLVERGVDVTEVQKIGENPRPFPHELDNIGFVFFDDPDGNSWTVQQISTRP